MSHNGKHRPISEFIRHAEFARRAITPGRVDWSSSPWAWMLSHGPRTKSKLAREIVRDWLVERQQPYEEAEGFEEHHLVFDGQRVYVQIATQGKEGALEYSQLREPGMGVDVMWCLGVEPQRVRIWRVNPGDVAIRDLPVYREQVGRLHHLAFDPDEPPGWWHELVCWHGPDVDDDQESLF